MEAPCNTRLDDEFLVSPVRPNPVTESADLLVQIAKPGNVKVDVRNVLGQVVSSTEYSNQNSGAHKYTINAGDLRSGIYVCTVTYNGMQHTQKITIQ